MSWLQEKPVTEESWVSSVAAKGLSQEDNGAQTGCRPVTLTGKENDQGAGEGLTLHRSYVPNLRPPKCDVCEWSFNLSNHMRI